MDKAGVIAMFDYNYWANRQHRGRSLSKPPRPPLREEMRARIGPWRIKR